MPPVQRVTAFAESPGNTVTSCEVWLVCGCGNSLVWFESGMSCIFLPTDRGSQEMSRFPFALGEANPVSLSFSGWPSVCKLWGPAARSFSACTAQARGWR